jgi:hypothetical protein
MEQDVPPLRLDEWYLCPDPAFSTLTKQDAPSIQDTVQFSASYHMLEVLETCARWRFPNLPKNFLFPDILALMCARMGWIHTKCMAFFSVKWME